MYHRQLTTALPYNATGTEVRDALRSLALIGDIGVSRQGPDVNQGFTWIVTFFTERGDLPPLLADTSALYGSSAAIKVAEGYETKDHGTQKSHLRACKGAKPTVQSVTTMASSNIRGVFALDFVAFTLVKYCTMRLPLRYKSRWKNYLQLDPLLSVVTGPSGIGSYTWMITFSENSGELPKLIGQTTTLSGLTTDDGRIDVSIVQNGTAPHLDGNFRLTFRGSTTGPIPWNASAVEVKSKLESLDSVGLVNVSRSKKDYNDAFTWHVTFLTERGDVPELKMNTFDVMGTDCPLNKFPSLSITGVREVTKGRYLGGNFSLELAGLKTSTLAFDTSASIMENELQKLSPMYEKMLLSPDHQKLRQVATIGQLHSMESAVIFL